eukprot:TRINITY_DN3535_c0_g1_i1.p2 TRINITY_DN3535_c0_g1~~TRINITY_DN3535_c0_g1_i1.p2  ORF type:complete len:672 (+),score=161.35 TRINITY_DN3535_c0_g1_i1:2043-4058(+)
MVSEESHYEIGYARFPSAKDDMTWAINKILAAGGSRINKEAFLQGGSVSGAAGNTLGSTYLSAAGLAVLRTNADDYLLAKFGPHGGGHGHYDKLSISFFSHGYNLIQDYGTVGYELPQHEEYFKRTLSHTCLQLDYARQPESSGAPIAIATGYGAAQLIAVRTTAPLGGAGTYGRRALLLLGNDTDIQSNELPLLVDVVEAYNNSNMEGHTCDLFYHSEGTLQLTGSSLSSFSGSLGSDVSYSYWTNVQKGSTSTALQAVWSDTAEYCYYFESYDEGWSNVVIDSSRKKDGTHSGRWDQHTTRTYISVTPTHTDWSAMQSLSFWLYAEVANGAIITMTLTSENSTSDGWDYFVTTINIDFTGWKLFSYQRDQFGRARHPVGWSYITDVTFNANGWGHEALATTVLYIDAFYLFDSTGTKLQGDVRGMMLLSPQQSTEKDVFTASAPSVPTSLRHPVYMERQTAEHRFTHLVKPYTSTTQYITQFTVSGEVVSIKTPVADYALSFASDFDCFSGVISDHSSGDLISVFEYGCAEFTHPEAPHFDVATRATNANPNVVVKPVSSSDSSVTLSVLVTNAVDDSTKDPVELTVYLPAHDGLSYFSVKIGGKNADIVAEDTSGDVCSVTFVAPASDTFATLVVALSDHEQNAAAGVSARGWLQVLAVATCLVAARC